MNAKLGMQKQKPAKLGPTSKPSFSTHRKNYASNKLPPDAKDTQTLHTTTNKTKNKDAIDQLLKSQNTNRQAFCQLVTNSNATMTTQLAQAMLEIQQLREQINKNKKPTKLHPKPSSTNYCWMHGYCINEDHTSLTCKYPCEGQQKTATHANPMGGSTNGKPK